MSKKFDSNSTLNKKVNFILLNIEFIKNLKMLQQCFKAVDKHWKELLKFAKILIKLINNLGKKYKYDIVPIMFLLVLDKQQFD
jgi:hypothetical protein